MVQNNVLKINPQLEAEGESTWYDTPYQIVGDFVKVNNWKFLTCGPILPNVICDVLVTAVGVEGIGLYLLLRRRASGNTVRIGINTLARACRIGVRRLNALLADLE